MQTPSFDDLCQASGSKWYATDLQIALEYATWASFKSVIDRAITACTKANMDVALNFERVQREQDGVEFEDYKLSRLACYLIAMNGDTEKAGVALAQTYFAKISLGVMGKRERAAHIFRITENEARIESEKAKGQATEDWLDVDTLADEQAAAIEKSLKESDELVRKYFR